MKEEYVTVKSYDDKLVRIPTEKKEEYLQQTKRIKELLENGKSIEEVLKYLREDYECQREKTKNYR